MNRSILLITAMLLALPGLAFSGPDDFICDTAIYGGETALVKPNVLIIFDTSGSMTGTVDTEVCVPNPDYDLDGVNDVDDNCPFKENADQADADSDGVGDVCDDNTVWPDTDGDGVPDKDDNCPADPNGPSDASNQVDSNGNGVGDVCEPVIPVGGYDPSIDYTKNADDYCGELKKKDHKWKYEDECKRDRIYECKQKDWNNGFCEEWKKSADDISEVRCDGNAAKLAVQADARDDLAVRGHYVTSRYKFKKDNKNCEETDETRHYATGNWIVWFNTTSGGTVMNQSVPPAEYYTVDAPAGETGMTAATTSATSGAFICSTQSESKQSIARKVIEDLVRSTSGVNFGLMRYNGGSGATFIKDTAPNPDFVSTIKDMNAIHSGTKTNEDLLVDIIRVLPASGSTPLGESMFEAMRYLTGGNSAFGTWTGAYPSPINASCQQNYIIFMTDGESTADDSNVLTSICGNGDCDKDGNNSKSDSMDDIAKYLHDVDLSSTYNGTQNALTFTIGFGLGGSNGTAIRLLEETAANGGGEAYLAENYQTLTRALTSIIGQILEVNTSFVAPVVPTNPENRVFSGKRVYLGFFKPSSNDDWKGNLKKFGLSYTGDVVDKLGIAATDANGRFLATSTSHWSINPDGSNVDEGGVGQLLVDRDFTADPRQVYVYTGTQSALTHSSNAFSKSNAALLPAMMGAPTTVESYTIIDYLLDGIDVYDSNLDGDVTEKREWIMGDILHSKPVIQAYNKYALADENDPAKNGTILYLGSNDGQLHAFRDADGKELWSFIPPIALKNVVHLGNNIHNYFVDNSPRVLVWDNDHDGNIGSVAEQSAGDFDPAGADDGSSDKVILIFGMRRGSGIDTLASGQVVSAYYAIDVTNPLSPVYLWELTNQTSGFSELAESWSTMEYGRIRLNGVDRLVAAFGAGYDTNDDLRFGNTQTYPDGMDGFTETTVLANASIAGASDGTSDAFNPKGRGIYILELATLNNAGVPTWHSTPVKLWEYVYDAARVANNPTYAFPTDVAPVDINFDGNMDLIYAGDTGGQMWRFDVSDQTTTANWNGTVVFTANPSDVTVSAEGSVTNGRRILYPPSVTVERDYIGLFFGTGDRAHPLNEGTTDRMYAVYDRGQTAAKTEANLVNVTVDDLQLASPAADPETCTANDMSIKCILKRLRDPNYFGWFIKLDESNGEKVLAPALVFNKVAYFTTYSPNVVTTDPCLSGNLGVGKTYAVNYKTGEAVFNYDLTNDDEYDSNTNERATSSGADGVVLRRTDRVLVMGSGIPSGVVVFIREDGSTGALVGCGGGVCVNDTLPGGTIFPIYWMKE